MGQSPGSGAMMPNGFDYSFFNVAPRDQQLDAIGADATLVLENLSTKHARLESRLPSLHPHAFRVPVLGGPGVPIHLACDTVWIDTDRATLTLTWRGCVPIPAVERDALGTVVVVASSKDGAMRAHDVELLVRSLDVPGPPPVSPGRSVAQRASPHQATVQQAMADDPTTRELEPITLDTGVLEPATPQRGLAARDLMRDLHSGTRAVEEPSTLVAKAESARSKDGD